ncbi:butyrophilin subfamily 1 member A1-like isoform X2 [Alosa pseudoharengus]|uniref:butyrophilin subfamily 1 member A1-like isoform X2 n=1 Tax=Alosa pseudoharengus TaxID=34774 RepID=UPI003F88A6EF
MAMTKVVYRNVQTFNRDVPAGSDDEEVYTSLVFRRTDKSILAQDGQIQHFGLYKLAVVFLGLLCVFLLAIITGLSIMITEGGQQLQDCYISQAEINATTQERDELYKSFTNLVKEKSQVQDSYNQLCEEKSQLEAACSTTAEERDELRIQLTKLVRVTLDPDTAHPNLILSADGKQVRLGDKQQHVNHNPKRFNAVPCVLGKEGFSSVRFYYEVQVSQKMCWDIGVARESIKRRGNINYSTKNGFWITMMRGNKYFAPEIVANPLSLKEKPQRVGVFVDYEAGLVSFYDADSWHHIHSFTGVSFIEKLYPFLSTCAIVNQIPMTISSPVKSYC